MYKDDENFNLSRKVVKATNMLRKTTKRIEARIDDIFFASPLKGAGMRSTKLDQLRSLEGTKSRIRGLKFPLEMIAPTSS